MRPPRSFICRNGLLIGSGKARKGVDFGILVIVQLDCALRSVSRYQGGPDVKGKTTSNAPWVSLSYLICECT